MAKRPRLVVTHDDDGGITVNDKAYTGLMVSIIGSHPDANGPKALHVEVYPYTGEQDVVVNSVPGRSQHPKHPHLAFVAVPRGEPLDDEGVPENIGAGSAYADRKEQS